MYVYYGCVGVPVPMDLPISDPYILKRQLEALHSGYALCSFPEFWLGTWAS